MSWSINNVAHLSIWRFARSLHVDFVLQSNPPTTFVEGGEWLNAFIISAPPGADSNVVRAKAGQFAEKFNAWIVIQKDATYEQGVDKNTAIKKLADALAVPDSKLSSVGDVVDDVYLCKGEQA
jgi:hypothetical protein